MKGKYFGNGRKRTLFVLVALCCGLIISLAAGSAASEVIPAAPAETVVFSDTGGHWAAQEIKDLVKLGLVQGYPNGTFQPERSVSRAEFITVINRALGFAEQAQISYEDVPAGSWYSAETAKAKAVGYVSGYGDGTFRPANPITREEAAVLLCQVLKLDKNDTAVVANHFKDAGQISAWSKSAVGAAAAAGYLGGYPDGTCRPQQKISRAESAALIDRIIGTTYNTPGTYGNKDKAETIAENVTITKGGITLENITITGDLYLTAGIGEGSVKLNKVVVKGRTVICGGGMNSIELNNAQFGQLIIARPNKPVRVVASGSTAAGKTLVLSGASLEEKDLSGEGFTDVAVELTDSDQNVELTGDFNLINLNSPVKLELKKSTVYSLEAGTQAGQSIIDVQAGTKVTKLLLNAPLAVKGEGSISSATVNVNGVTFQFKPDKLTLAAGVKTTVAGKEVDTSTGSGGGGGGGGGGGTPPEPEFTTTAIVTSGAICDPASGLVYIEINSDWSMEIDPRQVELNGAIHPAEGTADSWEALLNCTDPAKPIIVGFNQDTDQELTAIGIINDELIEKQAVQPNGVEDTIIVGNSEYQIAATVIYDCVHTSFAPAEGSANNITAPFKLGQVRKIPWEAVEEKDSLARVQYKLHNDEVKFLIIFDVLPDPEIEYGVVTGFSTVDGEASLVILKPDGEEVNIKKDSPTIIEHVYGRTDNTLMKGDFIQYALNADGEITAVDILGASATRTEIESVLLPSLELDSMQMYQVTDSSEKGISGYPVSATGTTSPSVSFTALNENTKFMDISDPSSINTTSGAIPDQLVLLVDTNDDDSDADYVITLQEYFGEPNPRVKTAVVTKGALYNAYDDSVSIDVLDESGTEFRFTVDPGSCKINNTLHPAEGTSDSWEALLNITTPLLSKPIIVKYHLNSNFELENIDIITDQFAQGSAVPNAADDTLGIGGVNYQVKNYSKLFSVGNSFLPAEGTAQNVTAPFVLSDVQTVPWASVEIENAYNEVFYKADQDVLKYLFILDNIHPDPEQPLYGVITAFSMVDGNASIVILKPDGEEVNLAKASPTVVEYVYGRNTNIVKKGDFIRYKLNSSDEIKEVTVIGASAQLTESAGIPLAALNLDDVKMLRVNDSNSVSIKGCIVSDEGTVAGDVTTFPVNSFTKYFEIFDTTELRTASSVSREDLVLLVDTDDDGRTADYVVVLKEDYGI